jgi:hypothetical protein
VAYIGLSRAGEAGRKVAGSEQAGDRWTRRRQLGGQGASVCAGQEHFRESARGRVWAYVLCVRDRESLSLLVCAGPRESGGTCTPCSAPICSAAIAAIAVIAVSVPGRNAEALPTLPLWQKPGVAQRPVQPLLQAEPPFAHTQRSSNKASDVAGSCRASKRCLKTGSMGLYGALP